MVQAVVAISSQTEIFQGQLEKPDWFPLYRILGLDDTPS